MTAKELAAVLNKRGILSIESLKVGVTVTDARTSWGNIHYEVTPESGHGTQWVSSDRVELGTP